MKIITIYDLVSDQMEIKKLTAKHFLALAEKGIAGQTEEAMDYWYLNDDRNYDTLKQNYPLAQEILDPQEEKIKIMSDWCKTAEIAYTPTVFINGKLLPSTFILEDLKDIF